ncbi:unnamed protein product [Ilex paraguariensis]|uniref:DNA-directed RNA polymerase N-terminal domain-containing protein n=1 Tax=Ilex paraguariensis TaxID=185542 RepID=A0ABC8RDV8_9AQUA
MRRSLYRQAYLKKLRLSPESCWSFLPSSNLVKYPQGSHFPQKTTLSDSQSQFHSSSTEVGFPRIGESFSRTHHMGIFNVTKSGDPLSFSGSCGYPRDYASVAEAIVSTSEEDIDEIQELQEEMSKENNAREPNFQQAKQPKLVGGMGIGKYTILRRRQMKMETEAWQEAAKEYQELLMDMCEQKLAPNLPYIKSLFLGWFEPVKDAIAAEQALCKEGKNRTAYAMYFDHLPADMMAVITMHKLMGLLMTEGGNGSARVVQAACQIGEAIEQEHHFGANFASDMVRANTWKQA